MKQRRSLTHVGGEVLTVGDRSVAMALASALDVPPSAPPLATPVRRESGRETGGDDPDRAHVHGFHTYPARLHPVTAARLVKALSVERATVLDPFCGSGTVLVEAMISGRRAIGTDLNPLAVRLARLKTARFTAEERDAMVTAARTAQAFADSRRTRRAGATHRYPAEDVEAFDPHVLLELDSLQAAIPTAAEGRPRVRDALELVLSAILVKASRRTSDTSKAVAPRRLAAGFTARLFAQKAEELARRLEEFSQSVPAALGPSRIELDDATRLRTVSASTVDVVITSPPYVGTYDYLAHHELRMRWLNLNATPLSAGEIGSRRRYATLAAGDARKAWSHELGGALAAMARVCRTGARVALVMADSAVGDEALRADEIVAAVAGDAGFALLARASQRRPHFHSPSASAFEPAPRSEHAILLQKR